MELHSFHSFVNNNGYHYHILGVLVATVCYRDYHLLDKDPEMLCQWWPLLRSVKENYRTSGSLQTV
jgi:hypothetical protein